MGAIMAREVIDFSPGEWVEELTPPKRRFQIMAVHSKPGTPAPNVELAVDGNPVHRLSLSIFALADMHRFRRVR
ncbi:hypothetical protein IP70_21375 [alpha proteobacterium AAP38]|jgi:hypothetical protein|uniref:Uncharacterized protein n=2 Tax=Azospirillaceae TaxID=2829815 RepID=A0A2K9NIY6_9PROT|nr:hypothetical protein C0V82_21825 [Niveispirillum cyanobacteriorum]KPF82544.1 hypothetical protein IP70_21375 [alpha proteobacterium AAP38]